MEVREDQREKDVSTLQVVKGDEFEFSSEIE